MSCFLIILVTCVNDLDFPPHVASFLCVKFFIFVFSFFLLLLPPLQSYLNISHILVFFVLPLLYILKYFLSSAVSLHRKNITNNCNGGGRVVSTSLLDFFTFFLFLLLLLYQCLEIVSVHFTL